MQFLIHLQTRRFIGRMAFVALGTTQNQLDNMYDEFGENEKVINVLEKEAAERNVDFPLQESVDSVLYELRSAAQAYTEWQPSTVSSFLSVSKTKPKDLTICSNANIFL